MGRGEGEASELAIRFDRRYRVITNSSCLFNLHFQIFKVGNIIASSIAK